MAINAQQKKFLRAKAHHLNITVSIGNKGLTAEVVNETKVALGAHELIKIRLPQDEKAAKAELLKNLCQQTSANNVQLIGRTGVIYTPANPPVIVLPKK
ncbi:MAG: RNA-binding protein [Saprospiraceae bacterium]|jgi:RNA-binding protein